MKTTLNLDDELLQRVKSRAVEEKTTLTRLIEQALRQYLRPKRDPAFQLRLLIKKGRLVPGVDLADRDSLYERMERR